MDWAILGHGATGHIRGCTMSSVCHMSNTTELVCQEGALQKPRPSEGTALTKSISIIAKEMRRKGSHFMSTQLRMGKNWSTTWRQAVALKVQHLRA